MPLDLKTTWQGAKGISRIRQFRARCATTCQRLLLQRCFMIVLFLIPVLILATIAVVPLWPYNRNWSYYPTGGLGAILVLTIVLLFLNRI